MELNQIALPSTDVERAVAFYRTMGLRLIVEDLPKYARFEVPSGHATLSILRVDSLKQPTGVVVYFECDDLDASVAALEAKGIVFDTPPQDQPWLWREAHVRDPDGNVLCLYWAGANRRWPPWRVQ
jgi:predicted enzyme related to lactoylglutathione lyase